MSTAPTEADVVDSRLTLHHLPDFWKAMALHRARGILRLGGVLRLWDLVYDFAPEEAGRRIEAWCATGASDVEGSGPGPSGRSTSATSTPPTPGSSSR